MGLVENQDFVLSPKTTYFGPAGLGEGCLLGTKRCLLGLPKVIDTHVWNHSITTTTYSVDGRDPVAAIRHLAALGETNIDVFEQWMRNLGAQASGAVFVELASQKRLKVKAGWFSKGVYYSEKQSGPGWGAFTLGAKPDALAFVDFYRAHPLLVG